MFEKHSMRKRIEKDHLHVFMKSKFCMNFTSILRFHFKEKKISFLFSIKIRFAIILKYLVHAHCWQWLITKFAFSCDRLSNSFFFKDLYLTRCPIYLWLVATIINKPCDRITFARYIALHWRIQNPSLV